MQTLLALPRTFRTLVPLCLMFTFSSVACSSSNGGGNSGSSQNSATSSGTAAAQASTWCAAAAKTQIVQGQGLQPLFGLLCSNGQATALFSQTLVNNAYSGSGAPSLQMIQPTADSNGTVSGIFGIGIKMGVTAETDFAQIAPSEGQTATETQEIAAEGGTPGNVNVQTVTSSADTGWIRGWIVDAVSSSNEGFTTINTEYVYGLSQYQLAPGLYMETSTIQRAVSTVQDYEVLTAFFDIGGVGYKLVTGRVAANDYGQASTAASALQQVVTNLVEFMYNQTKE